MPVFAEYNFDNPATVLDEATGNGAQNGDYFDGAYAEGGQLHLDGVAAKAKIYASDEFQLDRGTLEINFTPTDTDPTGPQTVLSRDSVGENAGSFRIDVNPDGSVSVTNETAGGAETFTTGPGFYSPGDAINLSYSWDQGGAGGALNITNQTTGTDYAAVVPNTVSLVMEPNTQPWMVGSGQSASDPGALNNLDQHFQGTVEFFTLSDTVDNGGPGGIGANPDSAETDEDTPVVVDVLGNDTGNGTPLTVSTATAGNGTVTVNPDGTLTYTPDADWNGTDTITYEVTDDAGNTASSTVTVVVNPVNDAPDANDDTATTPMDVPVVIAPLTNDSDVDGDALTFTGVPVSADGTVELHDDGTLTFTPNPGFTGDAVIEYGVTDPEGLTDTAQIIVTVTPPGTGRDGIVRGTEGGDLIDISYVDPTDGDRVDADDAIIPGDAPNDDRIVAGGGDDTIRAGLGDDTIYAGAGDDQIDGGNGHDLIFGEDGNDTITGGNGRDTVYGGEGDDTIDTSGTNNPLPDIDYPGYYGADTNPNNDRDLVFGGNGNDTIRTGDDADTIYGGAGQDQVDAGWDADLVYGGDGDDTLIGNEGADTIHGDAGNDLIFGGLDDTIGEALDIPDDRDLRPENNTDLLFGGDGDDTIYGRDDDDTLYGDAGNDVLYGGIDEDLLFGGAGNDTLFGGEGNDWLYGDEGDDRIETGSGANVAYGGAGSDTILGQGGSSSLYGGADRDTIIIDTPAAGFNSFIDGNEEGDDYDTLDLSGAGPLRIDYSPDNPENGTVRFLDGDGNEVGTLDFINIENVVPCFTPGTLIATPKGEIPAEELKIGDKVITRDNGIQEIRWIGEKALTGQELRQSSHLQPVLVKAHSLGNGLPERDMLVSPNHRLLVANDRTQLYFDEHEVLVAAKHLVGQKGIHAIESIGVSYIHFMCDQHEVVLSNGAWTESFQPGDYTLKGMGNAQRNEIFDLFPELKTREGLDGYQAARRTLKRHEARLLAR